MNTPHGTSLLDACVDVVRRTEPPPLRETDTRRMVRKALLASARPRRISLFGWRWAVALTAVGLFVIGVKARPDLWLNAQRPWAGQSVSIKPLNMRLPSNDVLTATPNARFDITANVADNRQIALRRGVMLFEVEPLKPGQRFEVYTPHAHASVRGTIFSVEVTDPHTVFRVYEGVIQVVQPRATRMIRVNEAFATDSAPVRVAEDAPLLSEAIHAVRIRAKARQDQYALQRLPEQKTPEIAAASVTAPVTAAPGREQPLDGIGLVAVNKADARRLYPNPIEAQRRLYQGQVKLALRMAQDVRVIRTAEVGDWKLVEADALRALSRFEEAADAYSQASQLLRPHGRAQAGYIAAQIYFRHLHRPERALAILDAAQVDAPRSPLRERALLLRAQSMVLLGQWPAEIARRYLADYPDCAAAAIMRAYLENRDTNHTSRGSE